MVSFCKSEYTDQTQNQPKEVFYKNRFSNKFTREHLCRSLFLIKLQATSDVIKNETLTQVLFYEFYEIFKNTFFREHLWVAAGSDKKRLHHSFYAVQFLMFSQILLLKISTLKRLILYKLLQISFSVVCDLV